MKNKLIQLGVAAPKAIVHPFKVRTGMKEAAQNRKKMASQDQKYCGEPKNLNSKRK